MYSPKYSHLKIVLFLALLVVVTSQQNYAQSVPSKPPLNHAIETFTDSENRVFINRNQSYQFLFTGLNTKKQEILQTGGAPETLSFPEGKTEIRILADDGDAQTFSLIVDGTPPTSNLNFENAPLFEENETTYIGKNLVLEFNAEDASSGVLEKYWAVNNSPFNPFIGKTSFSSNEAYLIYFYAVDRVGNVEQVQNRSFEVDVTGPEISFQLEGPQNLSVTSPESSINLSATDNAAGTKRIYYWFDDSEPEIYSTTISLNSLSDGDHVLHAFGIDNVENVGDTLTYSFYLDRSAPEVLEDISGDISRQNTSIYISSKSVISLTAKDNKSGTSSIKFRLNQEPEKTYTQPLRLSGTSGNYSITYYTTDVVGNTSERQSFKVYLDNVPPATNLAFNGYYSRTADGYAINAETLIELDPTDLESGVKEIRYKTGTSDWSVYHEALSFSSTGNVDLSYYTIDEVNNSEEIQTLTLSIVEISDVTANLEPERISSNNSSFLKVGEALEGPEKEVFLWLSTSPSDTSEKFMLSFSEDSSTIFPIALEPNQETNLELNIEELSATYPVTIDGSAPSTILTPSEAKFITHNGKIIFEPGVSFSLSSTDNISGVKELFSSENGGRYQLYDNPLRGYYTEQTYIIRFYAVDMVGNEEEEKTYTFDIDATPPITNHAFLSNFSGANLSQHTTLALTAADNLSGVDTTYIQLNNNEPIVYNGEVALSELGTYEEAFNTIYFYSIDRVGNKEQRKQFNFKIDQSGPVSSASWIGNFYSSDEQIYIHPSTKLALSATDSEMEIDKIWYALNQTTSSLTYDKPISFDNLTRANVRYAALDVLGNQGEVETLSVIVDDSSPSSRYSISGNTLENGDELVLGKDTELTITAQDQSSGVSRISYSINNENLSTYNVPIRFTTSGRKIIRFKAEDRVGNVEPVSIVNLVYDQTAPAIDLSFSKAPLSKTDSRVVINPETLISIKSVDSETEVKSLEYKLDENEYTTYFRPLIISEVGTHSLFVKSIDLLGNENERQVTVEIKE